MMSVETETPSAGTGTASRRLTVYLILLSFIWPCFLGVVLYLTSGRWHWPVAWAYLTVYGGVLLVASIFAFHREQGFAEERTRVKEGVKTWDRVLAGRSQEMLARLTLYIVAGLDMRWDWSPPLALWAQVAGVAAAGLGYLLAVWAMAPNKFFGRYVRIQTDRGHYVVDTGPYRILRHPGYAGFMLFMLASAIALESLWALIPAGITAAVLVIRTALEDRTLIAELPGYAAYTQKTRYRLIPGIW